MVITQKIYKKHYINTYCLISTSCQVVISLICQSFYIQNNNNYFLFFYITKTCSRLLVVSGACSMMTLKKWPIYCITRIVLIMVIWNRRQITNWKKFTNSISQCNIGLNTQLRIRPIFYAENVNWGSPLFNVITIS